MALQTLLGGPLPAPTSPFAPGLGGPSPGARDNPSESYPNQGSNGYQSPSPPTSSPTTTNPYLPDPGYQAALQQEQLGISQNNAALNNQIAQRIIAYGDPALASMAGFGLDPQAAAFARQNYLSGNAQLARVDHQHQNNLQAIINQLAGHGLLFSGDTGYRSGQEDQNYGNTVYDAQQAALADILGYRQHNLQQTQGLHQDVINALQQAYQNYLNHPELGQPAPNGKTLPPPGGAPKIAPKPVVPKSQTVAKALVNPYSTGQKRFG